MNPGGSISPVLARYGFHRLPHWGCSCSQLLPNKHFAALSMEMLQSWPLVVRQTLRASCKEVPKMLRSEERPQGRSRSDLRSNCSFLEMLLLGTRRVQEALVTVLGVCPVPAGRGVLGKHNRPKSELKLQQPPCTCWNEVELISLVLTNTVRGKAAPLCFGKGQEWGKQSRAGRC